MAKLDDASWITLNARNWALVEMNRGEKPIDAGLISAFSAAKPFPLGDAPLFVATAAIRAAASEWRLFVKNNSAKPTGYGKDGAFKIRIWNADAEGVRHDKNSFFSPWLGNMATTSSAPFHDNLHCVNAVRGRGGWMASYSHLVSGPKADGVPIPDTFIPTEKK
jgi:hypothetical protein